ncbi:N-alpha-acetyltransferase RimI [Abditibacteriota bacterium]|nr:N-alpha-acetyltransferase RimI [Abditibacteriota bacterium]
MPRAFDFMLPPIRPATLADLPQLELLERASFPDFWTRESLQTALSESGYLVLVAGEVGFLIGWNVGEEAEIARLGVLAEARGQGIGATLVERSLADFKVRGVTSVFLEVRADNPIAIRLYLRAGFQDIARRKDYYRDGMDAHVMRLDLSTPNP